jgi:beta-aspartyl-peptidase (threonine type)
MKVRGPAFLLLGGVLVGAVVSCAGPAEPADVVLVIHGGAGVVPRAKMTRDLEDGYRADLEAALKAGFQARAREGGTSLDAVEAAIRVLENSSTTRAATSWTPPSWRGRRRRRGRWPA